MTNLNFEKSRWHSLDLLKGLFIFFAMWEHFGYFLNVWNKYYSFSPSIHGAPIPFSFFNYLLAFTFIPWVGHSFLFIACFNIGRKFKSGYFPKAKWWPLYFALASVEGFLSGVDLGDSLSLQPLQTWVIVFAIVALTSKWLGVKGVIGLFVLYLASLNTWLIPMGNYFEEVIISMPHLSSFEYNPRIEYFLGTACFAFLLGHYLSEISVSKVSAMKLESMKLLKAMSLGLALIVPWIFFGSAYKIDWNDVLVNEYQFSMSIIDLMFVWGLNSFVLCGVISLEVRNWLPKIKSLAWCGQYALLIYFCHRLFFLYAYGPLREILALKLGWTMKNDFIEILVPSLITVGLAYAILKGFTALRGHYRANSTA